MITEFIQFRQFIEYRSVAAKGIVLLRVQSVTLGPNWNPLQPKPPSSLHSTFLMVYTFTNLPSVYSTVGLLGMYCLLHHRLHLHAKSSIYSCPEATQSIICWHLQQLTWRNFAHGCWMPAIPLVAVWTLDKDGAITQALGKYLPSDVVEPNSSSCKQRKTGAFKQ